MGRERTTKYWHFYTNSVLYTIRLGEATDFQLWNGSGVLFYSVTPLSHPIPGFKTAQKGH